MSREYDLEWSAHPNIHNNYSSRTVKFKFTEPDAGINPDTGILLLIPGFGGSIDSNVYKKMRGTFADQYNLVVVQCKYFGEQFMQNDVLQSLDLHQTFMKQSFTTDEIEKCTSSNHFLKSIIDLCKEKHIKILPMIHNPRETLSDFCDMGLMQAIDNMTALYYVFNILKENQLSFNTNKIIALGQSHGSYLGLLCNALIPNVFDMIIDNSAYLSPYYLKTSRVLQTELNGFPLAVFFDYMAPKLDLDHEILDLNYVYKQVENHSGIISFLGDADFMIPVEEKRSFCASLPNCNFHLYTKNDLDGEIFKNNKHGLGADFIKLFEYCYTQFESNTNEAKRKDLYSPNKIKTSRASYELYFDDGIPLLQIT